MKTKVNRFIVIFVTILLVVPNYPVYSSSEDEIEEPGENPYENLQTDESIDSEVKLESDRENNSESKTVQHNEKENLEINKSEDDKKQYDSSDKEKVETFKLETTLTYTIDDRGSHVVELKKKLTQLGFGNFPSNPSKVYGEVTARVVKEFQEYYSLPVTGIADELTLSKIEEILNPPYKEGHRGLHIVQLKQDLTALDFGNFPNNPSLVYGSVTAGVVKEFQGTYGLNTTGIADEKTLAKIKEILSSEYKPGASGEHVRELKKKLTQLGFGNFPSNPSKVYGEVTARVVKEFQEYYSLPVTGIADELTLSKIEEILNPPYKEGHRGLHIVQLKQDLTALGFGNFPSNPSLAYGSVTAGVVKEFQQFYNLESDGVTDKVTLDLINYILNNPYKDGASGSHVVQLKKYLTQLGFGSFPENPSQKYGEVTTRVVKEFQNYYGLNNKSGNATAETIRKINELLNSTYQNGKAGPHIVQLKKDLKELGYGNFPSNPSDVYGDVTEKVVREFQEANGLVVNGIADSVTLKKIEELLKGLTYSKYNLTINEAIEIQMKANPQTDKREYAWVSKSYIDKNNRVTANALNVRTQPSTANTNENRVLGTLPKGTKVDIIDEKGNWYAIKYYSTSYNWFHATREDVRYYLNPNNFTNDEKLRYQFLDLSKPSGATRSQLNKYLKGKGVLENKGQAFIDAARLHRVNDVYLISHAILETGNGTSTLAKGVRVGLNSKNEPKRVTKENEKSLTKIKTVYNVYGIGAYDRCPVDCGAERAYSEGWDSVEKAITGGAQFIGSTYIHKGQNTLYKMRWNPAAMEELGYASHQYATDVGWATKQVNTMYNLYKEIGISNLVLDIPVYK